MNIEEVVRTFVTDDNLIRAIKLRSSECFTAMNIANQLGGSPDAAWNVVRTFSFLDMIREARKRGIDLSSVKAAVGDRLVTEAPVYHDAMRILSEEGSDGQ